MKFGNDHLCAIDEGKCFFRGGNNSTTSCQHMLCNFSFLTLVESCVEALTVILKIAIAVLPGHRSLKFIHQAHKLKT